MSQPVRVAVSLLIAATLVALAGAASAQSAAQRSRSPVFDDADMFSIEGRPWTGAVDGDVVIVVFSDYQCPFCQRAHATLQQVLDAWPDDVTLVHKHLPLDFHPDAEPAAIAAEAAFRQGAFWPFHDALLSGNRTLDAAAYEAAAQALGLDMAAFRADLADPDVRDLVRADAADASALGIRGTPNFLINGQLVTGAQPFERFAEVVEAELVAMHGLREQGLSRPEALAQRFAAGRAALPSRAAPSAAAPTVDPDARMFIDISDRPMRGGAEPLVTIVAFTDYQCPFCERAEPTLTELMDHYGDDLAVVVLDYPLPFHTEAEAAARFAYGAHQQGAFWPAHDALFAAQRELGPDAYAAIADSLGLDFEQLVADAASAGADASLARDDADRERVVAGGTPHFFVNGRRVRGAQPYDAFAAIIDDELQFAEALLAAGVDREDVYEARMEDAERGDAPMLPAPAPAAAPDSAGVAVIDTTGGQRLGAVDAPVELVVFSEFQCPYCSTFADSYLAALDVYPDELAVVFMHMPLAFHQHADAAARASEAAALQGAFEPYHQALFEAQARLGDDVYIALAEELGLDVTRFLADMESDAVAATIAAHSAEARRLGVRGTPTWFINGHMFTGARPLAALQTVIDEELDALAEP